jgi:hypothetical protein|tara:strand:- start:21253 stop:21525 length:273 start_codon:yes stop_codon:yes gene_type:complete
MRSTEKEEINQRLPISKIEGDFRGSYPSRGEKNLKTKGLRYANRSSAEVCNPKVLEAASTPIPRINAIKSRLITERSKGSRKIYSGTTMI